jgi:hypothetical protein
MPSSMEVVNTSETSINFYQTTWCDIPDDSHLQTRCSENEKFHELQQLQPRPPLESRSSEQQAVI